MIFENHQSRVYVHPTLTPTSSRFQKERTSQHCIIHTYIHTYHILGKASFLYKYFHPILIRSGNGLVSNVECGFYYCHSKSCSSLLACLLLQIFGCHKIKFQVLKKRWGFYYNKSTHTSIKGRALPPPHHSFKPP